MKTAVLFDFDGTLFYGTTDLNYYSINMSLKDMRLPPVDRAKANSTVGDTLTELARNILGSDDKALCDRFLDGMLRYALIAIDELAEIEPDCIHMLRALKEKASVAICSNGNMDYLYKLLKKFDIFDIFDYIWYKKEGYSKLTAIPELKRLLGADRVIMVGDREEDVTSGKANGCVTVAIQNNIGARDAVGADYDVFSHAEMERVILSILL
ncbi:MAG: HAD family hydrolase [Oscillospiraceae bacterium]|nr:HAD family hydrolase [Oscillospiraceae bacterium]